MAAVDEGQPTRSTSNSLGPSPAPARAAPATQATQGTSAPGAHTSAVSSEQPGPDEVDRSRTPSPPSTRPSPAPGAHAEGSISADTSPNLAEAHTDAAAPGSSPSTPTRLQASSSTSGADPLAHQSPQQQQRRPHDTGSSPVSADAADSSPASGRTASSPSSSASQSPSGPPPSRRVKVYRLKDDAWIDLGTGTCSGVFVQAHDAEGDGARMSDDEDEGAWIVVRREKARRDAGQESPTGKKGKGRGDQEGTESPTKGAGGGAKSPSKGQQGRQLVEGGADDDEEDEAGELILKTRVQPYPPGYLPEDLLDEEEMTSVDDNGNTTVDAGGYQRQQDTLIVWTERAATEGDEEQEMALSFATPSGCGEMWEFIKAARRFAGPSRSLAYDLALERC